jgi:hypothetical protein
MQAIQAPDSPGIQGAAAPLLWRKDEVWKLVNPYEHQRKNIISRPEKLSGQTPTEEGQQRPPNPPSIHQDKSHENKNP